MGPGGAAAATHAADLPGGSAVGAGVTASSGAIDDVVPLLATIGVAEWGVSRDGIDAIGPGPACPADSAVAAVTPQPRTAAGTAVAT
ncbi:hypothetical protein MSS4_00616 [Mycobacterium marinum]|nr:hypothetical protein MSS4_00616 [Mycobacterium marinum]